MLPAFRYSWSGRQQSKACNSNVGRAFRSEQARGIRLHGMFYSW